MKEDPQRLTEEEEMRTPAETEKAESIPAEVVVTGAGILLAHNTFRRHDYTTHLEKRIINIVE